uniref:Uncharacterized protein n=1 Tax=Rhizophora mucronata TaxID=61149 RepID=A0A2P2K527_RHIMU
MNNRICKAVIRNGNGWAKWKREAVAALWIPVQMQSYYYVTSSSSSATKARKANQTSTTWPRPREIPFQPQAANSVNLIGYVKNPVQFLSSPDAKHCATTVISLLHPSSSPSDSSPLCRIPITFEGDLAHIAACHLKENDCVYVAGQLSAHPPSFNVIEAEAQLQVMVHTINFVQGCTEKKISYIPQHKEESPPSTDSARMKKNHDSLLNSWRELLDNPKEWWDYRNSKLNGLVNPKFPDFKRKDNAFSLWIDSAPGWLVTKIKKVEFDIPNHKQTQGKQQRGDESWKNLVENPAKWWDNRENKVMQWNIKSSAHCFTDLMHLHVLYLEKCERSRFQAQRHW